MAQRTVIRLVDDLDDTEIGQGGGETISFALDGRQYEIDLTNDHASELRAALDRYVRVARKVGGRRSPSRATTTGAKVAAPVDYSPQAVRAWAKANKIDVSPRGRIPQSVVDQFRAAGN
ncbi:Lsr2 family protein [Geodermatophilus sp. SYSU D00758]